MMRMCGNSRGHRSSGSDLKADGTLRDHPPGLLSYIRHRITNAPCGAFHSSIQALKATARGFRNFEHYRTRILFFLGKLNLNPL